MSTCVGIDLTAVETIGDSLSRLGQGYLTRVYTASEIDACSPSGTASPRRLAGCFAAKEAVFKALGAGDEPLGWHEIEVITAGSGATRVTLHGSAARIAARARIGAVTVSVTQRRGTALAVAVAESADVADTPTP